MAVTAGTGESVQPRNLLHYNVLEQIGQGGMGVVYKGRDSHLDRFVALKVLHDRTRKESNRRFIREAKAASALNHPNIVTIYDIGVEGDVAFIAMEFVSGETLADAIPRQGLPVTRALNYAVQLADGLATAHRAGIIHRDLKPRNIMVADSGRLKILDFGLAKLIDRRRTADESETRTSDRTEEGQMVGTVAYMSPEQAEGRTLDVRSDIFSFGVLLYEMIAGRNPFTADTPVRTWSAIVGEPHRPVSEIVPDCPRELEQVIDRCLRKDPERRWQHMQDVYVALLDLKESDSGRRPAPATIGLTAARRRTWMYAAGAIVAIGVATAVVPRGPIGGSAVESELVPMPLTTFPGDERDPTFSPDGTQVAFSWGPEGGVSNTYVKLVGPGDPIRLTNSPFMERMSQWSPDGQWIAIGRRALGTVTDFIIVPALGGTERLVTQAKSVYCAWTPDSQWLIVPDGTPGALYRVAIQSGERKLVIGPLQNRFDVRGGVISPDGQKLAISFRLGAWSPLYVVPLSGDYVARGEPRLITPKDWDVSSWSWTADSRDVVFARTITSNILGGNTALYRVTVDGGSPRRLDFAGDNAWFLDVSRRGNRLAYTRLQRDVNLYQAEFAPDGTLRFTGTAVVSSSRRDASGSYSPDGTRVAFSSDRNGSAEIWVSGTDGRNLVQLTNSPHPVSVTDWPQWSPDGTRIVFSSGAPGVNAPDLYVVPASGGPSRRLTDDPGRDDSPWWSRDGKWIYFFSSRDGEYRPWRMPADDGPATRLSATEAIFPGAPIDSPDGAWVYFRTVDGIWRIPASGGDGHLVVKDRVNAFQPTVRGVYYFSTADDLKSAALRLVPLSGGQPKTIGTISPPPVGNFSISSDLKRILYARCDQCAADLMLVEGFR